MIDIVRDRNRELCTGTAGEFDSDGFDRVRNVDDRGFWSSGIRQAQATLHPMGIRWVFEHTPKVPSRARLAGTRSFKSAEHPSKARRTAGRPRPLPSRAVEAGIPEGEHPACRADQPVATTCAGRGDADDSPEGAKTACRTRHLGAAMARCYDE